MLNEFVTSHRNERVQRFHDVLQERFIDFHRPTSVSRYHRSMKTKPQSEEYRRFESLLGQVLKVSKTELNERLEAEKREQRASNASASRASGVRPKRANQNG